MKKQTTIYVVLLLLVIGIIIIIDANKPKPIDWSPTYDVEHKIPFGLYVFNEEIDDLFKGEEVDKFNITPYEFFDANYDYEEKEYNINGSFINVSELNEIDIESVDELLYFAEHGNTVFLSMQSFPYKILDSLDIHVSSDYYLKDSIVVHNKKAKNKRYYLKEGAGVTYFDSINTNTTTVLGYQNIRNEERANFIHISYGSGSFLLHTQPAAFTNYYLLKDNNYEYAEELLAYLPDNTIYWNTGSMKNERISGSPLRFILAQPALKSAWRIGLIALIIFMIFTARRKQRIVPAITPLKNTTVDFAKTIGNLYYQEGNHDTIIEKKIIYFLEKIRTEYLIDTHTLDETFIDKLHHKTGNTVEDIEKVIRLIKKQRHQFGSTEADLIAINKAIEKLRV